MLRPLSESEILTDIDHFEAQLAKLPPDSSNADDQIARQIFESLLEHRRNALLALNHGKS
jgi:hypothetical protein